MPVASHAEVARPLAGNPWIEQPFDQGAEPWPIDASINYCLSLAREHYENFPVVAGLFNRSQQEALAATYAFARTADDFADEPHFEGQRLALLQHWRRQLAEARAGRSGHPVMLAVVRALDEFGLDERLYGRLLDAFELDCRRNRYQTWEQLLDYCALSANPVGRIVLGIMGLSDRGLESCSDCLCTALQLTNHWQDLSRDLARDRLYVPRRLLQHFAVDEEQLLRRLPSGDLPGLLGELVERTRALYRRGRPLLARAGWRYGVYFLAVFLGGRTVLQLVQQQGPDILQRRPALGGVSLLKALAGMVLPGGSGRKS